MTPRHDDEHLRPSMGPELFKQLYGGKPFLPCLIELLKNCKDWGATDIWLFMAIPAQIRIMDNGDGMDLVNRRAFVSHATSSARGLPGKAGWFGTGTKHMLYSHCVSVRVVTAPKDSPEWVYIFEFTTKECTECTIRQQEIPCRKEKKNKGNWPHDFEYGTEITYTLESPKSSKISRGKDLAEKLAARLPRFFSEILRADGELIPQKKIIGRAFAQIEQLNFGRISYEFYRPEKIHDGEGLFLTAGEIGEVPVTNLYRVLGRHQQRFPQILLSPLVCGTICIPWLSDQHSNYINEDRFTIDPGIADDPRVEKLLGYLETIAPIIQDCLKIKEKKKSQESDEHVIVEVLEQCNAIYEDPEKIKTGEMKGQEDGDPESGADDPGSGSHPIQQPPAVRLSYEREYEIGEIIDIRATIRKDLRETYSLDSLVWDTKLSRAEHPCATDSGMKLTAHEEGRGIVYVTISGIPYGSRIGALYTVVQKRRLSLSLPRAEIEVGSQLHIVARNTDKVSELQWRLEGVGKVDLNKDRVVYSATRKGTARIQAYDAQDPSVYDTCDIEVTSQQERLFCIRGEYFRYDPGDPNTIFGFENPLARPVMMVANVDQLKTGEPIHQISFNADARGYQAAKESGNLDDFLMHAIALEFPVFWALVLEKVNVEEECKDPRDVQVFIQNHITTQKDQIYEELIAPKNKKKKNGQ